MHCAIQILALSATVSALAIRDNKCSFGLKQKDGSSVGQLSDGQNRLGGSQSPASYSISNGGITDAAGRGCILTPPTTQFQCDEGATPTTGFSIDCHGVVSYKDNGGHFYKCGTGDDGSNIYSEPPAGQKDCQQFVLTATDCAPPCPSPPAAPASTPAPPPPPKTCPVDLKGDYQFPHLIVPVEKDHPDTAFGTSYNGVIAPKTDSLYLFDIPSSYKGKTCSLIFLLPKKEDLQTSSYALHGDEIQIKASQLKKNINKGTTFNNAGDDAATYGTIGVKPGSSHVISTFKCPANTQVSYDLSSAGGALTYFQDYNPAPIGLYITTC